jgi:hypothetical protein
VEFYRNLAGSLTGLGVWGLGQCSVGGTASWRVRGAAPARRVYCAHINRRSLRLELYRFYTDTVVLQHTYE